MNDDMGDVFSQMFGDMDSFFGGGFSGGGGMDDLDDFINILEQDNVKSFNSMFRNLGKGYRMKPTGKNMRSRAGKKGK
jgi:hypothetical protein